MYVRSSGRVVASHGGVAPRLWVPNPRPRRALPCSHLRALTRSRTLVGALAGEYAAVVAYLLQLNGYPAGETPLPTNLSALQAIEIVEAP